MGRKFLQKRAKNRNASVEQLAPQLRLPPRPHTRISRRFLNPKRPAIPKQHTTVTAIADSLARIEQARSSRRSTAAMGLTLGKIMLGKIVVETPKHEVLHTGAGYEIRRYPPCVAAEVVYDPKEMKGDPDGGFQVLAGYIGVFGKPQNTSPEKIAMTSPVITFSSSGSGGGGKAEEIAMTAPVITAEGGDNNKVTMQFLLPSKYRKAEEAPKPTDERVVLRDVGERKYGVVSFSGLAGDKVVAEKAEGLKAALEKDGHAVKGPFVLSRYNPPWTLPPLRTNEVMIPVE